jgi:hypothetical protein
LINGHSNKRPEGLFMDSSGSAVHNISCGDYASHVGDVMLHARTLQAAGVNVADLQHGLTRPVVVSLPLLYPRPAVSR